MEMQRFYETLYITRPDISDEDISKVQNTLNDIITNNKGEVLKSEKWAERELSYAIENYTKGIYYLMVYKSPPKVVTELEKSLRFFRSDILRFVTVKIKDGTAAAELKSSGNNVTEENG